MPKTAKMPALPLPLPCSYWVIPGQLLAGEYPGGNDDAETQYRLDCLRAVGVTYFLDLTEPEELTAYKHLLPTRSKYLRSGIPDMAVPDTVTQMKLIQTRIAAALAVDHGVYVHCRAGIGRTGTAIGCFLVEQGLRGGAALRQLNKLWRTSERSKTWRRVPQTSRQADYILSWPEHRQFHNRAAVSLKP